MIILKKLLFIFFATYATYAFAQVLKYEEPKVDSIPQPLKSGMPKDVYVSVERHPQYISGNERFKTKLVEQLIKNKIKVNEKEKFFINFIINKEGKLTKAKVTEGNEKYEKEIINAIYQVYNKWNTGQINGADKPSIVYCSILISSKKDISINILDMQLLMED